ncbi:hypothetical protein M0L20_13685 [Spirosoma sp. RP8]|uniref:DUF2190 family protein n=1 Tax=Spirosoma liriopis TaxID=2937440 RepID=A0ABT0HL73_9BACT|nr:hypothetical protein [Spirosoma liriopis]MCK8492914.1 hypothetical protein [Spirosoma liriopis]
MANNKFLTIDDTSSDIKEITAIATSAGAADAGKIPVTGPNGQLDPSLVGSLDGKGYVAGEALVAGDLVYVYYDSGSTTNKIKKAIAGSNGSTRAVGIVTSATASGAQATVFARIPVSGFSGLTPGTPVYLSATQAGKITQSAAVGSGNFLQVVGTALDAQTLQLAISTQVIYRS